MPKSFITTCVFLVIVIFSTSAIVAQNEPPIDLARAYPPTLLGENDIALAQIDWQLKHLKQTRDYYVDVCDSTRKGLEQIVVNSNGLFEKLPMELRYTNEQVRAELIGSCLQELLSAKLEIASNEEIISQLSGELEKAKDEQAEMARLKKEQQHLKIQAIETKFALTKNEFERNKQLHEQGSVSIQVLERSRYSLQITEFELAQARLEMEIENASRSNEIAQQLVESRIETQPLKARAAAAEKFLKLYSDSSDTLNTIENNNRRVASGQKAIDEYLLKISATSDKIAELESLKELIQSSLKDAAKTKLEQEKD